MDTKNDKTYFELSDAEKKRIIKKAARDGAEMQNETWAKAIRKQAILDVIEALEMETQGDAELLLIMGDAYRTLVEQVCFEEGFNRAIKVLSFRITKLKEREGI